MEAVDSHPPIQTYSPLFWYSHNHPSLVILLGGLTRLSRLCSWLKFVTMKNTEQKQQEKDKHQGVYRGPAQVSSRATQDVLSLWQQTTGTRVDYLCSGTPIRGSGSQSFMAVGFVGTSYWQPAMTAELGTPPPRNEIRCIPSVLIFVQSNPDRLVQHGPLLQVYTTKSTHQWHREHSEVMVPGVGQGSVMGPVSVRTVRAKQPDLLG